MGNTIFVEGILGSGKSTLADTLFHEMLKKNSRVRFFAEHDIENPLDMTRKAVLTQTDYNHFCKRCCDIAKLTGKYDCYDIMSRIESKSKIFFNQKLISYYQIYFNDLNVQREVESLYSHEICNGMIEKHLYFQLFIHLFSQYATWRNPTETHVFEGALLQNLLFDLVAFYQCDFSEIVDFYQSILLRIPDVKIYYIKVDDIKGTLERAALHRSDLLWMSRFSDWIAKSPWGIAHLEEKMPLPVAFCKAIEETSIRLLQELGTLQVCWYNSAEILKNRMENGYA